MKKLILSLALASATLTACQHLPQTTPSIQAAATNTTERNKANALAFYDLAFNQHKVKEASAQYIGKHYLQHNPTVADGSQAFIDAFEPFCGNTPNHAPRLNV